MTYDELLDKWLCKLGRPCTAGEIVHDLRQLEQPVRCKDCKHFFKDDRRYVIVYRCELLHEDMRDYFFCADGERREDGEE